MKSHQFTCSHWPNLRSVQLVNSITACLAKKAASHGGRRRDSASSPATEATSSSTPDRESVPGLTGRWMSGRFPARASSIRVTGVRLSKTLAPPGSGMRRRVSGRLW